MLIHLSIQNYAIIDHLEMDLSSHLNVITEKTGTGKSIMLGAIDLLLGNRADTKVLWNEKEKCITEGVFDIQHDNLKRLFEEENLDYEDSTVLRREISPAGKSRAFINDTPVTLDVMKKIGMKLMDVHSQHETLELGNRLFQLQVIDSYAAHEHIKKEYSAAWDKFTVSKKEFEKLNAEAAILRQESDYIKFQLDELTKANLEQGEQERLESDLKIMEHAEDIKLKFNELLALLDKREMSASSIFNEVKLIANTISSYSESYTPLAERLESLRIELIDIIREAENSEESIEFDPEKIENTKERLSLIYQLLQKNRVNSLSELILIKDSLQEKATKTDHLDEELEKKREQLNKAYMELALVADRLSESRSKIFGNLCLELEKYLKQLGIPDAQLKVDHQVGNPDIHGKDVVEFLFSANKGVAVRPLAQVASGGEFARLMFCIKYILAQKASLPTLILDEIDTGVSGEIAIQLGRMMKSMAKHHQLLAISHLPQIAAKADQHFYAYKVTKSGKTISQIKLLSQDERIEEIAKMIGGEKASPQAKESAKELMMN